MKPDFRAAASETGAASTDVGRSVPQRFLARVVDAGLCGVALAGPWFMGGRHPLGELVLVALAVLVSLAWLAGQALTRRPVAWHRSSAEWLLLGGVLLVVLQLIPLPQAVLDLLSPHTRELLPLWRGNAAVQGTLGNWSQLSMTPDWTQAGLVLLLAYGLLFLVAVQRLKRIDDVEWLVRWLAVAVSVQAAFGIVQYLTSNGKFVWIYQHPFRDTYSAVMGAYMNKNHFAHLMALGIGPLVWWVATSLRPARGRRDREFQVEPAAVPPQAWTIVALLGLGITVFAGLMTLSRGGAAAMLLAALLAIGALYRVSLLGKKFVLGAGGVAALLAVCLVIHGYSRVADRLDDYSSGSIQDLDKEGARRAIWAADFRAVRDYSLCGAGVGSHREIYPMYLQEPWETEFTHAENGYLQVALETGLPGLCLLVAGILLAASWCRRSLRRSTSTRVYACSAAVAAGLLASVAHSVADFVWYIPSLMAITVLLLACAYRLSCLAREVKPAGTSAGAAPQAAGPTAVWSPLACATCLVLVAIVGPWMVYDRFCATMAESHWDRFLVWALDTDPAKKIDDQQIIGNLEGVLRWTPQHAIAHVRLATQLISRFERLQLESANAMPLQMVCDAAFASRDRFRSRAELDAWLERAVGPHRRLLDVALWHLRRGLTHCPLLGEAYIHLSDVCFLDGGGPAEKAAYLQQALKVRPYDGVVLLAAGSAAALRQDVEGMLANWRLVLRSSEEHRRAMVKLLTSSALPIEVLLERFQPDLAATRLLAEQYAKVYPPEQLQPLSIYHGQVLEAAIRTADPESAPALWNELHRVFRGLQRPAEAVACLRRAAALQPSDFDFRYALGWELCELQEFAEAEPHLAWCAQRRPADQQVKHWLATAVKGRLAGQSHSAAAPRGLR